MNAFKKKIDVHYVDLRLITEDYGGLHGAMRVRDGFATGWHVTSSPENLISWVKSGKNLKESSSPYEDIGRGLYVSDAPYYWRGRAVKQWEFLNSLSESKMRSLAKKIQDILFNQIRDRYITESEFESAYDLVRNVELGVVNPEALVTVAGQPYNISFAKRDFLDPLGIKNKQPMLVRVDFTGLFVDLEKTLNRGNVHNADSMFPDFDGAFTKSGFSTSPQTVIWNRYSIIDIELDCDYDDQTFPCE